MGSMDDDRACFLLGRKPHLLYFWNAMDICHLLPNTLTVLPAEFSASSDGIPSTLELSGDRSATKKSKREHDEQRAEDRQFKQNISESFGHLATASALERKMEARVVCWSLLSVCCYVANSVLCCCGQSKTIDHPNEWEATGCG